MSNGGGAAGRLMVQDEELQLRRQEEIGSGQGIAVRCAVVSGGSPDAAARGGYGADEIGAWEKRDAGSWSFGSGGDGNFGSMSSGILGRIKMILPED
uniref:Uncharacterized protein n=1 Tax=Leersia perrieri TaxID=77586 RepID=A0A0D9XHS0_9ORYZ